MRTINEIVEKLNNLLCKVAEAERMTDEEIEEWGFIMMEYRTWKEIYETVASIN